ncbi:Gti1/Pac2 family-domain-containing protein [Auriculariales sp. MPI-PUGE-AT-0066]|nr:Gti1/Pac2 family-domain-containing protein [Auriculariales sp. MPI-PUGE-AT-0066]
MPVTCSGLKFATPDDAKLVVHAVRKGLLPACSQRLTQGERNDIRPGDVYVWTGRAADAEAGTPALERWTDGYQWGPSRMKDEFLFYHEKRSSSSAGTSGARIVSVDPARYSGGSMHRVRTMSPEDPRPPPPPQPDHGPVDPTQLIKQSYSVICDPQSANPEHWHLTTYFTSGSIGLLQSVRSGHVACLVNLTFPADRYKWFKAYKLEMPNAQRVATDSVQTVSSRRSATTPTRGIPGHSLPPLTTIAPFRQSSSQSPPPHSPASSYGGYASSPSTASPTYDFGQPTASYGYATGFRSTPLLPLRDLENAHPLRQRSERGPDESAPFTVSVHAMRGSQRWPVDLSALRQLAAPPVPTDLADR